MSAYTVSELTVDAVEVKVVNSCIFLSPRIDRDGQYARETERLIIGRK